MSELQPSIAQAQAEGDVYSTQEEASLPADEGGNDGGNVGRG